MILGLGVDLVDIRRVEKVIQRHGARFVNRAFTPEERRYAEKRKALYAATLAKRYAAKEACAKALGTGLGQGVRWQDIGVLNGPHGAPQLVLQGRAAEKLAALAPPGFTARAHLTLTDEYPLAQATVILSA